MTLTEKQKMLAGELCDAGDAELQADLARAHQRMARYNSMLTAPKEELREVLREVLRELLKAVGHSAAIRSERSVEFSSASQRYQSLSG